MRLHKLPRNLDGHIKPPVPLREALQQQHFGWGAASEVLHKTLLHIGEDVREQSNVKLCNEEMAGTGPACISCHAQGVLHKDKSKCTLQMGMLTAARSSASHRHICEACALKHSGLRIDEEYHIVPAGEPLLQGTMY